MLLIYRTDTGEVLDNSGTLNSWPEGPPDDLAWRNVDERGISRDGLALLRLHDENDADLVQQVLHNRHHVNTTTGQVVIDGPYPVRTLAADPDTITTTGTAVVTYTDTHDDAPVEVTFNVNGATATVTLINGTAELEVTPSGPGPIMVSVADVSPTVIITVQED